MKLKIEQKWLKVYQDKPPCNDCGDDSQKWVKYPKLKPITVCMACYNEYYKWQIARSFREQEMG